MESSRQPERAPVSWFAHGRGKRLSERVLRECTPELTRVFGHSGLYLRPSRDLGETLPGNMLARVLSLYREGEDLAGPFRCRDAELPIESSSQSLVLALFVFESSDDAGALIAEIARILKPEGVAMLLALNPWSPSRVQWWGRIGSPIGLGTVLAHVRDAGLETTRHCRLGPIWLRDEPPAAADRPRAPWFDPVRAAALVVARRREPGLTPLRPAPARPVLAPAIDRGAAPV